MFSKVSLFEFFLITLYPRWFEGRQKLIDKRAMDDIAHFPGFVPVSYL